MHGQIEAHQMGFDVDDEILRGIALHSDVEGTNTRTITFDQMKGRAGVRSPRSFSQASLQSENDVGRIVKKHKVAAFSTSNVP